MKTQQPEDKDIQAFLEGAPIGGSAPEGVKRRLRVMAGESRPLKRVRWAPRLAVAGAIGAVAVATVLLAWPTSAAAKTFQRVVDATMHAHSFSMSLMDGSNGQQEKVQIAAVGESMQIRSSDGEIVQIGGAGLQVYDPKENTLLTMGLGVVGPEVMEKVAQGLHQGLRHLNVRTMLQEFKQRYGEQNMRVSNVTQMDGRDVYTIELADPAGMGRAKIVADAKTDLPLRIQASESGGQAVDLRLDFGAHITLEPIETLVPSNAKRLTLDLDQVIKSARSGAANGEFEDAFKGLGKAIELHFSPKGH